MKSISCHVMLLVINSIGGGHTNAHTYTYRYSWIRYTTPGLKSKILLTSKCKYMANNCTWFENSYGKAIVPISWIKVM